MTISASPEEVARWMLQKMEGRPFGLYQDQTVVEIKQRFGEEFTYINANGNVAISKPVLAAFRRLSGDGVVWSRSERCWRRRAMWDRQPGRQQD
jgi:hypothetical protein